MTWPISRLMWMFACGAWIGVTLSGLGFGAPPGPSIGFALGATMAALLVNILTAAGVDQ